MLDHESFGNHWKPRSHNLPQLLEYVYRRAETVHFLWHITSWDVETPSSHCGGRWRGGRTTSGEPGGKPPKRGPDDGRNGQEGGLVSTNNRETCLSLVRTPMADSASTATTFISWTQRTASRPYLVHTQVYCSTTCSISPSNLPEHEVKIRSVSFFYLSPRCAESHINTACSEESTSI